MCRDTASQQPGIPLSFPTHIDLQRLISELCPANESSAEVKCKLAVTKTGKKIIINHGFWSGTNLIYHRTQIQCCKSKHSFSDR